MEAGIDLLLWRWCLATLLHHKVANSTTCRFGFYSTITSHISISVSQFLTPLKVIVLFTYGLPFFQIGHLFADNHDKMC